MKSLFLALTVLLNISNVFSYENKRPWNNFNDPRRFYTGWEGKLAELETAAQVDTRVWSGYYWPHKWGGIALRWDGETNFQNPSSKRNPHNYKTPSRNDFTKMSFQEKNALSPAEKYDISNGRFDYPTVQRERQRTNPKHPLWFGICEGWAAASVHYDEPHAFNMQLQDGNVLPFASSDIKALLSYHESQFNAGPTPVLGQRCQPNSSNSPACWDTNPATLHLVLGNHIGNLKKPFIMDVDQKPEVWNQPVFGYKSTISNKSDISPYAARGTVREVYVKTIVWYLQESGPYVNALTTPIAQGVHFDYTLELDRNGIILGGEWITAERPDFVWLPRPSNFNNSGYYRNIEYLYNRSLPADRGPDPLAGIVNE